MKLGSRSVLGVFNTVPGGGTVHTAVCSQIPHKG